MKDYIQPLILVVALGIIVYLFCKQDKNLQKALQDIQTAQTEIQKSYKLIESTADTLDSIRFTLVKFKSNSDSLYTLFDATASNFIRYYNVELKPKMVDLKKSVDFRNKKEKEDWKPIKIINQ